MHEDWAREYTLETYAIIAGDEHTTLTDARNSPEWPEWQTAMKEELTLLDPMGTWELVDAPAHAVPIPNKWTYIRKRNKQGEII